MRKLLLSLLLVVVLVVVALPFVAGFVAKKEFMAFVDRIPHSPNLQIEVKDYQRGWYRSSADVEIKLKDITQSHKGKVTKIDTVTLILHKTLKHGPIIFDSTGVQVGWALARGTFEPGNDLQELLKPAMPEGQVLPQLNSELLFKLTGGMRVELNIPQFSFDKPGQAKMNWGGFKAHWDISRGMKNIDGNVVVEALQMTMPKAQVQQGKITLKYKQHEADGLWVGKATMNYPKLDVTADGKPMLNVSGITLQSESNIAKKLLGLSMQLRLEQWRYMDLNYGPGKFVLAINNLDADTVRQIKQQLEAANEPSLSDQQRQLMLMSSLPLLPKLVDKGADFQLHTLSLNTPQGQVRANAKITFTPKEGNAGGHQNMFTMIKRVNANANAEVPVSLVEEMMAQTAAKKIRQKQVLRRLIEQQRKKTNGTQNVVATPVLSKEQVQQLALKQVRGELAQWVKQGMLTQEGKVYKVAVKFEKGQLTVNGKSISPMNGVKVKAGPATSKPAIPTPPAVSR